MKLNIGCGRLYQAGWVNVDVNKAFSPDMIFSAQEPWPISSDSCDEVRMFHVLEHLPNWQVAMSEAARVLKDGGYFEIRLPHLHGLYAAAIGHLTFWSYCSARMLAKGYELDTLYHASGVWMEVSCRLRLRYGRHTPVADWLININPWLYEKINILPPDEIVVILQKVQP